MHIDIPSKTIHFVADILYDTTVSPVTAQSTRNFRLLFRPNKSGCCISIFPLSCPAKLQSKHSSQQSPPPLDPRQHYFSCCRRQGLDAPTRPARYQLGWAKEGHAYRLESGRESGSGSIGRDFCKIKTSSKNVQPANGARADCPENFRVRRERRLEALGPLPSPLAHSASNGPTENREPGFVSSPHALLRVSSGT